MFDDCFTHEGVLDVGQWSLRSVNPAPRRQLRDELARTPVDSPDRGLVGFGDYQAVSKTLDDHGQPPALALQSAVREYHRYGDE